MRAIFYAVVLAGSITSALAQQVFIPDPCLNAAIRSALPIPTAPLTAQDLLNLTNLLARNRSISNLQGLEGGRNLVSLDLAGNGIPSFALQWPDKECRIIYARLHNPYQLDGSIAASAI
jgi:hypothetical protein